MMHSFLFLVDFMDRESTMMEKCKAIVHFGKEEWNTFVESVITCIQNKQ